MQGVDQHREVGELLDDRDSGDVEGISSAVSKVLMPRSTSTISWLPALKMYSAALSHSSMVAVSPRLSWTGFGHSRLG